MLSQRNQVDSLPLFLFKIYGFSLSLVLPVGLFASSFFQKNSEWISLSQRAAEAAHLKTWFVILNLRLSPLVGSAPIPPPPPPTLSFLLARKTKPPPPKQPPPPPHKTFFFFLTHRLPPLVGPPPPPPPPQRMLLFSQSMKATAWPQIEAGLPKTLISFFHTVLGIVLLKSHYLMWSLITHVCHTTLCGLS